LETISKGRNTREKLSTSNEEADKCEFENYDALLLMSETAKMRKLITKRGHLKYLSHYVALQISSDIRYIL
jgi:hypothetical protein